MAGNEQKIDPRLARNYGDLTTDDQRAVYRQWADSYDEELIEEFGYIAPQEAVSAFVRRVPDRTAPVLDMGCGTGLAGKLLDQAGYAHIDGIDLSPEMLEKAAALNVYRQLWEGDLTAVIDVQPIYQAVICVGVFSHKSDQPFLIPKLLDCLLPGGLVIATVNGKGWRDIGWVELLEESQRQHDFKLESVDDIGYLTKQGIDGKLLTIRLRP